MWSLVFVVNTVCDVKAAEEAERIIGSRQNNDSDGLLQLSTKGSESCVAIQTGKSDLQE